MLQIYELRISEVRNLRHAAGDELRGDCPFCNDHKGHLYINPIKGVFYCQRCAAAGKITEEIIQKKQFDRCSYSPQQKEKATNLNIEQLNKVYNTLLMCLKLKKEHYHHLLGRGFSKELIEIKGYKSLSSSEDLAKLARKVASTASIVDVPGFYQKGGKWMLVEDNGILIPCRNFEGKIWGIQIRTDDRSKGRKYCWLSSAGREKGTKATAVYHVAVPTKLVNTKNVPKRVWITEGPLKGDYAAEQMGETFICVPGVNAWKRTGIVEVLVRNKVREVIICYDADAAINIYVAEAAYKLYNALRSEGIQVQFAWWEIEKGKGIDDLLKNGYYPNIVSFENWQKRNQLYRAIRS